MQCYDNPLKEVKIIDHNTHGIFIGVDYFTVIIRIQNSNYEAYRKSDTGRYKKVKSCYIDRFCSILTSKDISNLIKYNYDNFISSRYFRENMKEIVKDYELKDFYYTIYVTTENTNETCVICYDDMFVRYVKCENGHVICQHCYENLVDKKVCCLCQQEYDHTKVFYVMDS